MCVVSLVTLTHCYDYSTLIKSAISAIFTNVGHVLLYFDYFLEESLICGTCMLICRGGYSVTVGNCPRRGGTVSSALYTDGCM